MIVIKTYANKVFSCYIRIQEDPTPGSWGDYLLLKDEYRNLDEDWLHFNIAYKDPEKYRQMIFNMNFLKDMKSTYQYLHCVYCGKDDLVIYGFRQTPNRNKMATADHFIPKSQDPQLAYNVDNLRVCCDSCNRKKGLNIWEEKYPYVKVLKQMI